jgi:tRNA nucleotidyltransferase (CCA-adding enzyme)
MIFKNITARMKENIPSDLYKLLKKIAGVADKEGTRIYLVGGAVRDIILKYKNLDIDIVVEGEAIKFALTLSKRLKAKLIVYQKFQTAILILPEGLRIDLASSRTEYYEYPAALPTVELSSIKHDLSRRDFTINAMAVSLNKDSFGRLIDFFGGLKDIKEKKIRVLHNLSFIEDPTRIFRAVRFETRFDFTIDEQTEHLIKTAVSEDMFEKIAGERMKDEIIPILCEPEPIKGVKRMHNLHELRFIHPKLKLTPVCVKYFKAIKKTLRWSEKNLKDKPVAWLLYFMALTTNLNSRQIKQVADRFVFSNKNAEKLFRYKKDNKRIIFALRSKTRMKASSIYKILNPYSIETLLMILTKVKNERSKKRIKRFFCDYKDKTLKVCGEDLKKLGLKPSKKFKNILNKVFYIKLDKGLKTKEEEMKVLRTIVEK